MFFFFFFLCFVLNVENGVCVGLYDFFFSPRDTFSPSSVRFFLKLYFVLPFFFVSQDARWNPPEKGGPFEAD